MQVVFVMGVREAWQTWRRCHPVLRSSHTRVFSLPAHPLTLCSLGGIDLRWTKILRSMRVLRVGLLSSELRSLHLRLDGWREGGRGQMRADEGKTLRRSGAV